MPKNPPLGLLSDDVKVCIGIYFVFLFPKHMDPLGTKIGYRGSYILMMHLCSVGNIWILYSLFCCKCSDSTVHSSAVNIMIPRINILL
jgi:hypothetical protein